MLAGLASWRWRFGAVLWLPFLFPGVLLGLALIWALNRPPFGVLYQSAAVVLLALVARYLGAGWQVATLARRTVDPDLVDAARLAGGTRWQVFRLAVWPQVSTPLLAGWYLVYLLCLWDIETLVLITPPGVETLSLRIFNLLPYGHNPQVNALCLALLGLALLPLGVWATMSRPRRWRPLAMTCAVVGLGVAGVLSLSGCSGRRMGACRRATYSSGRRSWHPGRGAGQFNKPRTVAVDERDNVYAVDMTGRVQKFDRHGDFLLSWQMPETDLGRPKGMALDGEGRLMVIEPHYSRVNHFTTDGQLVQQWGEHGTNLGQLAMPRAVAINSRGEIWVCEYGVNERIQRFSKDGRRLLASFGRFGSGPASSIGPRGWVWTEDRLYVADSCNHRIQVL
jgi:ABC-type molybdate transport system permease subunit